MASCEPSIIWDAVIGCVVAIVAEDILLGVEGQVLVRDVAVSPGHPSHQVAGGGVRTM